MRENTGICKYGFCDFLLRKNGCGISVDGRCRIFVAVVGSPPAHSPSATQLNIADTTGQGDPVRNRNNRPLLYLAFLP